MADEKNNSKVVNPHDKVFREVYSNKENAWSLLADKLPDKVLKLVDLNTLEISKDSFIEKELADYYSDILYKVNLTDGSQGFIYVLFEHKSYYDKFVHLQLLEYMVKIWRLYIKQHKGETSKLPIVIPLLICHGRKGWPEDTERLISLLSGPVEEIAGYIPDFGFELYDLLRYSDDQIKGTIMSRMILLHIAEQAISKETGEYIMTLAEKLRNEGEIKGEIKGLKEGIELGITYKFPGKNSNPGFYLKDRQA
jgi:predicted transposase YdaD